MTEPADPTELAGVAEMGTEAVEAWSYDDADEDYPLTGSWADPERRWTPRRITIAAVAASVLVASTAAGIAVWRLRQGPNVETTKVVVATEVTTTVVPEPVKPLPPPSAVPPRLSSSPPSAKPIIPIDYDQRFISALLAQNWYVNDRQQIITTAHRVCFELGQGESRTQLNDELTRFVGWTLTEAVMFVRTAEKVYPDCP